MTSKIEICNMALRHCHSTKSISSLTERQKEAGVCNTFYDISLFSLLESFRWGFATKIESLGLVEKNPNDLWQYSYAVPSDFLKATRILSGIRNETLSQRVPFDLVFGDTSSLIYTDQEGAKLEYIKKHNNPSQYPPSFTLALSYLLAFNILPSLSVGDTSRKEKLYEYYQIHLSIAQKNDLENRSPDLAPESEAITARY